MLRTETIRAFDPDKKIRREIEDALESLREFRRKYPLTEPKFLESLTADTLYKKGEEYFFLWIQYRLSALGQIGIGSDKPFVSACKRLDDFKGLLRIAIDPTKSLREKIDAHWGTISGMGGDKIIPKKIIACYDERVLPVFKTKDMKYFYTQIIGPLPSGFDSFSLGEQYEFLTQGLINEKQNHADTKDWPNAYFMRFLYQMYPPPKDTTAWSRPAKAQPLSNIGLLFSPRTHEEMVFLFAKLHDKVGFPYIKQVQSAYPDVCALDRDGKERKIEIEVLASQFDHQPKGCDTIVCWENDLETTPKDWPEIIQLRDYMP